MRIGIHLGRDSVVAAARDRAGHWSESPPSVDRDRGRAIEEVLRSVRRPGTAPVDSVTVDVSDALVMDRRQAVISVLIEPRLPLTGRRHLWAADQRNIQVEHVRGGHNALGHELVPLDEEALARVAAAIPPGAHVVISAAGAVVNPYHERRAAEILRAAAPGSVTESHIFSSDSLLARENTAVMNALLRPQAERVASMVTTAVARSAGEHVPIYIGRNDGGCEPIARLPITPIHSLKSASAMEMLGAADLLGVRAGRLVLAASGRVLLCELDDGLLPVARQPSFGDIEAVASSFAQVVAVTDTLLSGSPDAPVTLLMAGSERELSPFGLEPTMIARNDLVSRGAVTAKLSQWYNAIIRIENSADVARALLDGQEIVRAHVVAAGADPELIRIVESRVLATTYGESQMVQVRVRGIADVPAGSPMLRSERSVR